MAKTTQSPSGVLIYEDFRDNLILDRYDPVFSSMRGSKLSQLKSENSEDALTWNVFRSLCKLDPVRWFPWLFTKAFSHSFEYPDDSMIVHLWRAVSPPLAIRQHQGDEGDSEVDVILESENCVWFIEAKYKSDVSAGTTNNPERDQILRNIDVGSWYASPRDFYFSLLILDEKSSPNGLELIRTYSQEPDRLRGKLPHRADGLENLRGTSLLTWSHLAAALVRTSAQVEREGESEVARRAISYLSSRGIAPGQEA